MAKKLPDGWRHAYCVLIAEGYTHKDAADAVGVAAGTVRRHLQQDDELRELYVEARETVRDKIRNEIWKLRLADNEQTSRWAYDHLIKWNLPEAKETQQIEISTPEPIRIEGGRRPVGIADVFQLAHELGVGLGTGLRTGATDRAVPATEDVRPGLNPGATESAAEPVAAD